MRISRKFENLVEVFRIPDVVEHLLLRDHEAKEWFIFIILWYCLMVNLYNNEKNNSSVNLKFGSFLGKRTNK